MSHGLRTATEPGNTAPPAAALIGVLAVCSVWGPIVSAGPYAAV